MGEVKENVEGAEVVRVVDSMRGGMGLIAGYSGCAFPPRILEGTIEITVMGESVVVRTGNAETLNVISLDTLGPRVGGWSYVRLR